MAGTIKGCGRVGKDVIVSMESGLDGRNNSLRRFCQCHALQVSMESGLDGRNNATVQQRTDQRLRVVSMESGLDGRNNAYRSRLVGPHQSRVSMESGLDGRNNLSALWHWPLASEVSQWSPA